MKPLVVIPARGGSKGVPQKNIKILGSKPLIQYTIEAAREVFNDDQICVSTDDIRIKEIAEKTGLTIPFIRPTELSQDNSGTYEVLLHALDYYEKKGNQYDTIILLQPTSPFRTGEHIREALKVFDNTCEMVVSVKIARSNPYYTLREESENGWLIKSKEGQFTRRQDCPIVYEVNGAIYIINVDALRSKPLTSFSKVRKYVMDEIPSHDIDSLFDWDVADYLVNKNYNI
ncbi:MAG: acylneuraminate cytidylyltransferase family protein [Tenuifilaceae bacterium]